MNLDDLKKPFPPEKISWRLGATNKDKTKGMALAYIDARDVMERLDEVCGPGGWQTQHHDVGGGKLACAIGILVPDPKQLDAMWIWKSDGAGATDVEADKGAFSDSLKRAAVQWGIGRYLYNLDSPWVALMPRGKSYVISDSEYPKLNALLGKKPDAKKPWVGPLNLTDLKKEMRDFSTDLQSVEDYDALVVLLNTTMALQEQCRLDLNDWWLGAEAAIEKRQEELAGTADEHRVMEAG